MSTSTPTPLAVRPAEAARMMGIGRTKLYGLFAAGELHPFKLGAATLVEVVEIRAYLDRLKQQQAA